MVAVRGLNDTSDGPWFGDDTDINDGLAGWWRNFSPRVRLSVFGYSPKGVFVRPGVRDISSRLLEAIMELRAGKTHVGLDALPDRCAVLTVVEVESSLRLP